MTRRERCIYEWATGRFKQLMAEDRIDDALALADEFFEWLDPEQLHSEETLFTMKNNSNNTSLNSQKVDDTMRSLIMNYINATNKGDHAAC